MQQWFYERASMLRYAYSTLPVLLKCKRLPSSPYMTSLDWALRIILLLIYDVSGDASATMET